MTPVEHAEGNNLEMSDKYAIMLHSCRKTLAAGEYHTVCIKSDGRVAASGEFGAKETKVSRWENIIAVDAGENFTIGLRKDGTVVFTGEYDNDCDDNNYVLARKLSKWEDIVAFSAGDEHVVGIRNDGKAIAAGENDYGQCNVSSWQNLLAVSAGATHTVGLKKDGTVVAVGENESGECNVLDWSDIIAVIAGSYITIGLKADGTVVYTGMIENKEREMSKWSNIISLDTYCSHIVGLMSDGRVVATGSNDHKQCEVSDWRDIIAVASGNSHTVGLKSDGSIVAVGFDGMSQCWKAERWHNMRVTINPLLEQHIQDDIKRYKEDMSHQNRKSRGGCYIATCVYGSYDCQEVWTLRRFRDSILNRNAIGRIFIRFYYTVSPKLVKYFGSTKLFKAIWKLFLDKLVYKLNEKGVANTRYYDK